MFENIMVPVDFSSHSRLAFGHARLLAEAFGAEIELVHVVEQVLHSQPSFWSAEPALADELHRQSLASAERVMAELARSHRAELGPRVQHRVVSGSLPGALADCAADRHSDLIVLSTHGRTGFARWLLGSVAERLLRVAPCPVLVVRGATAHPAPRICRVLVALDLSEHSRRAVEVAAALAKQLHASLEALHVWAPPLHLEAGAVQPGLLERLRADARAELDAFVRVTEQASGVSLERTLVTGPATAAINQHVSDTRPDLLVLGTHGHGGVKRMMLGSVAEALARYASCATLVVR